ncbi:Splicing factor U2AF 26 kDa subunit [Cichlidogyrus casuarinus]|uniref:Splicing factor U2AF 26 kDa subunit n=1 Tax=Cichlidogyrus casuarinus TaxID=1844966 RepID=A0ABD2QDR3_9PLAT
MAEYLASIFGTEKDKLVLNYEITISLESIVLSTSKLVHAVMVNNALDFTTNQHSVRRFCFKTCILLLKILLINMTEIEAQQIFDDFFEEVFAECEEKYGEIEEMNVCDNLGDHLVGNVYIKFRSEKEAQQAVDELNQRWFGGRPIHAELSPVTDFREACCRQYELGECTRGGFCNFMHLKPISKELCHKLYKRSRRRHGRRRRRSRSRSRGRRY